MRPRPAPRDAEYAADCIALLKRDCKSKKARVHMAELAIRIGNYTDEGRTVWRNYLLTEVAA